MLDKLREIIESYTGNVIEINEDTVLMSDLGMNSFELVQLACSVEDEFDIEIPDKDIKKLRTIGDILHYINSQ